MVLPDDATAVLPPSSKFLRTCLEGETARVLLEAEDDWRRILCTGVILEAEYILTMPSELSIC